MKLRFLLCFMIWMHLAVLSFAQTDSVRTLQLKQDTSSSSKMVVQHDTISIKKPFAPNPKYAILRAAILPGWGQFYNRKYWKMPIVYAGLGTAFYFISVNYNGFIQTRNGIAKRIDDNVTNDLDPIYVRDYNFKKYDVSFNSTEDLLKIKHYFRKNLDLALIGFTIVYVMNIVDADVDAHLYQFNMSNDLTFHPLINSSGIGLAINWK